jgi:hypothetical protein
MISSIASHASPVRLFEKYGAPAARPRDSPNLDPSIRLAELMDPGEELEAFRDQAAMKPRRYRFKDF